MRRPSMPNTASDATGGIGFAISGFTIIPSFGHH
jgi:hypothetical protein